MLTFSSKGAYNPALHYYLAELYEDFLFVGFLPTKHIYHFLLETVEVRGGSSEDGVFCFVLLIYSFPILSTCFEVSRRVTVLSSFS